MPYPQLNRADVVMKPLAERKNKINIERDHISPDQPPGDALQEAPPMAELVDRVIEARRNHRPVMLTTGAHTIKNGLSPVLIALIETGWITHLATNGAGVIHDWELAYQGETSEDVRAGVALGEFGNWEETGFYLNLAINIGAYEGKGYGESVGAMIENGGLEIPLRQTLIDAVRLRVESDPAHAAASADLVDLVDRLDLKPGRLDLPHRFKDFSVQAAAFRLGIPFTAHPMIGHDIIYNHPMNHGSLLGRAALRDFLAFAQSVRGLDGGVYLSVGSAVMSPMIFEKSLSMAQNLAIQAGGPIEDYYIMVVDLADSHWDWSKGEPPSDNPDYYLRYNKTFNRMGGAMRYLKAHNRDFLLALYHRLRNARTNI